MNAKKKSLRFNDLFVNNEFALDTFLKNHKAYLSEFENDTYGFENLCLQNISDINNALKGDVIILSDDWVYTYRQDCESKRTLAQKESAHYLLANSIRHFCRALEHFKGSTSSNRTAGLPTYFLCQGVDLKGYAYGLLKIDIEKLKKLGAHEKLGGGKKKGAYSALRKAMIAVLTKNPKMTNDDLWAEIKSKPPKGHLLGSTAATGRYVEITKKGKTTSSTWDSFKNTASKVRGCDLQKNQKS